MCKWLEMNRLRISLWETSRDRMRDIRRKRRDHNTWDRCTGETYGLIQWSWVSITTSTTRHQIFERSVITSTWDTNVIPSVFQMEQKEREFLMTGYGLQNCRLLTIKDIKQKTKKVVKFILPLKQGTMR